MATKPQTSRPLTARKEKFCQEYVKTPVGTTAAKAAGYTAKHLDSLAARLLAEPEVKARVAELQKKAADVAGVTAVEVLRELKRIALCDVAGAFNKNGGVLDLKDIPEDVRRAISGLDIEEIWDGPRDARTQIGVIKKIRFWNKVDSGVALGKHLKLFVDRIEASGKDGEPLNVTIQIIRQVKK